MLEISAIVLTRKKASTIQKLMKDTDITTPS